MKKLCRILLTAVILIGLLAVPVHAAPSPGGLSAFENVLEYAPDTFSDVPADSWYADGVRMVYQKGIMNGAGGGRFEPFQPLTWTQAVVIAARIDADYNGIGLGEPRPGEAWYSSARAYAYDARLITATRFWGPWPDNTPITRQEMAHLFRHVLNEEDLPAINDAVLTDLDAVASHLRSEVQELCAAGILTGRENGAFDPEGSVTRAETALIVSRLLDPGQRVSRDLRVPRSLREWGGSFYNGGFAAPGEGVTYFLYSDREYTANGSFIDHGGEIIARADTGGLRTVFTCSDPLDTLLLGDDGMLYAGGQHRLRRVDPANGSDEILYTAPDLLISYILYDNAAYVLERYEGGSDPDQWRYRIGRVMENGVLDVLTDGMSFAQSVPAGRLSCFNGRLYFAMRDAATNADCLYAVDLSTKALEQVLDQGTRFTGYPISGATVWYAQDAEDAPEGGSAPLSILRASLLLPELSEQAAVLPARDAALPLNAFAGGGQLYLQSPEAGRVWRVLRDGTLESAASFPAGSAGYCAILKDCVLLHAKDSIGELHMDDITVLLPDGSRVPYPEYLGKD